LELDDVHLSCPSVVVLIEPRVDGVNWRVKNEEGRRDRIPAASV
jgi:hypothetical protein